MPTVLITGANRGIGLELARQYAADGWTVLATCRDPGKAAELKAVAGDVAVHRLDVDDPRRVWRPWPAGWRDGRSTCCSTTPASTGARRRSPTSTTPPGPRP